MSHDISLPTCVNASRYHPDSTIISTMLSQQASLLSLPLAPIKMFRMVAFKLAPACSAWEIQDYFVSISAHHFE